MQIARRKPKILPQTSYSLYELVVSPEPFYADYDKIYGKVLSTVEIVWKNFAKLSSAFFH